MKYKQIARKYKKENPAGGVDVRLLLVLCVVRWFLRRADHSYRGEG